MPNNITRYQIIELLDDGQMAKVYRAYDPYFDREVAIKVIAADFMHHDQLPEQFKQEAKRMMALEHPAIVPVYDFGEENGQPFLVMRLMRGGSLKRWLANGQLSWNQTVYLLERLALALDTAHRYGMVHGDIKPDNILFDDANHAYLADFGVTKLISQTTQIGHPIGSPPYMSPEQARGEKQIDGRSDIYSLGVLLFEMLSGQRPYQADSLTGYTHQHLSQPVPDIRQINPSLPQACQNVILRAMAKEPTQRYHSASEMVAELKTIPYIDEPKPQKRKRWLSLVALLAGGVGGLFIICMVLALTVASNNMEPILALVRTPTPTPTVTPSPTATPTATLTPSPTFTPTPNANAIIERADALRDSGQYEEAIAAYSEAINLDPNNAQAYFGRAYSHAQRGELDLAIADYTNVIRIDSNDAVTYNNRGVAYADQGQLDLAIADYDQAIRLDPDYALAYNNRGFAYQQKGELDLAIADYSEAIRLDPDYALAYRNRASAYLDKGELDLTIADCDQAIRLNPDDPVAYAIRAYAYDEKGELDLAIADYSEAIRINPDYALAYNNRGFAYEQKGELDLAIADYRKAVELGDEVARENLQNLGVEP